MFQFRFASLAAMLAITTGAAACAKTAESTGTTTDDTAATAEDATVDGAALADATTTTTAAHFEYEGEDGPAHWGDLSPAYIACKTGTAQSPIDLKGAAGADLPNLGFAWLSGAPTILNNGHTIQVSLPAGGTLTTAGAEFPLAQFHFHAHSEHTVDGKTTPLEIHFVHKNAAGELAVVGVLVEEGAENATLGKLFASLPADKDGKTTLTESIDPATLLPTDKLYYRYAGSLTTPPCSEGVKWHVLKSTITASKAQIEAFTKLYENDARPVQPLGTRDLQIDNTP